MLSFFLLFLSFSFFFFFGSLAEPLENFSGHVLLIPLSFPLFHSFSFSIYVSLPDRISVWFYICVCVCIHIYQWYVLILSISSSDCRVLVCPVYPLHPLSFRVSAFISTTFLLSHSPVSFSSSAVYHCCLAGLCVNPGLVEQPCLLSPSASLSLSEPPESSPCSERWHRELNPCMCLWTSDKFLPPRFLCCVADLTCEHYI